MLCVLAKYIICKCDPVMCFCSLPLSQSLLYSGVIICFLFYYTWKAKEIRRIIMVVKIRKRIVTYKKKIVLFGANNNVALKS